MLTISGRTATLHWAVTDLALRLKRRAPNAHTFLEVIKARYGVVTHIVFLIFGLMTNILVTAMLLTGGSAVASSLCGVPTAAACFLLPIGVVLYVSPVTSSSALSRFSCTCLATLQLPCCADICALSALFMCNIRCRSIY
jgi:predicted tellurium resistance membrane protein TerC